MQRFTNRRESITAYVDPSTGGILFQALAASFAVISGPALLSSWQIQARFASVKRVFREQLGGEVEQAPALDPGA